MRLVLAAVLFASGLAGSAAAHESGARGDDEVADDAGADERGSARNRCQVVDAPITTAFFVAGCQSPVGMCTSGTIASGPLKGTTSFEVLTVSQGPTADTLVYTGLLTITTATGTIQIRDRGILDTVTGKFFEIDAVTGGTGAYAHAHGLLTSQGLDIGTGFDGTITGAVCQAPRSR